MTRSNFVRLLTLAVATLFFGAAARAEHNQHHSMPFKGAKVNGGTVTHSKENGKMFLTLSEDFQVPDTPDPHWQIVDSKGQVFRLQAMKTKGGISNRRIEVPSFIKNISKVQVWCAFAEVLLGETAFPAGPIS